MNLPNDLKTISILMLALMTLSACANSQPTAKQQVPKIVGGDRDAHGCIGSAGYVWCEREKTCVRAWELASLKGFELNEANFRKYCSSHP